MTCPRERLDDVVAEIERRFSWVSAGRGERRACFVRDEACRRPGFWCVGLTTLVRFETIYCCQQPDRASEMLAGAATGVDVAYGRGRERSVAAARRWITSPCMARAGGRSIGDRRTIPPGLDAVHSASNEQDLRLGGFHRPTTRVLLREEPETRPRLQERKVVVSRPSA
jgi:hypothetical protein